MNLEDKINVIKDAKDDIKSAIISKGVTPSGNISTYANAINEINTTNNTSLTVVPSTTAQTIRVPSEYTGYDVVNVNAVTSAIDSDIKKNNIKFGVNILGITGNVIELKGQTKNITTNGVYTPDSGYNAFTSVVVDTPMGIKREVSNGVYQMPTDNYFSFILPNNVTDIGDNALKYAFEACIGLITVDLSSLTEINGEQAMFHAFGRCLGLTGALDLSNLTIVSGDQAMEYAFYFCRYLTSINLSSLTTISGVRAMFHAFDSCDRLTSVNFSSLTIVSAFALQSAFALCSSLTSIFFPSLTSNSFGFYTNQFNSMLYGVTGCTVHFPSNLQSVIGSWSDVTAGFGGTNTTVLFDLPATT